MHNAKASQRKIFNRERGKALTKKQWAKTFFALLHNDHFETVLEYLDELPEADRKEVQEEMTRMARMIDSRRGYEFT